MGLATPDYKVQKLQTALHAKAKAEPNYRFYSLWDKMCRSDVLKDAYRACRTNGGAPGIDGERFEDIESRGLDRWLGNLQQELRSRTYRPQPLLRVWIEKANGGKRPLSIPTIRCRVVQTAAHKVLSPIFEADFFGLQYGFRPGTDAKAAVRKVHWCVTKERKTEIVDADLKDYFTSIPHGPLFRSLSRRIADGTILAVIKAWVTTPVVERDGRECKRTTQARDLSRGTAQGSPLSPLLSNVYFRRFMAAWYRYGYARRFRSTVVNYADDFVICCEPGFGAGAKQTMEAIMARIGLQVNVEKTKIVKLPAETLDFLGYSFCRSFTSDGRQFIGTRPSRKAVKKVIAKIHGETSRRWFGCTIEKRVAEINAIIRGWSNYFNQGPVLPEYRYVRAYTERRLRKWLMRKHKQRGTGYRQYPDDYLYKVLGLYQLPWSRGDQSSAKA